MAYTSNYLRLVYQPIGGTVPRQFFYTDSAPDNDTAMRVAGYFSDGAAKGMRVGDLVDVVQVGTAKYIKYQVSAVSAAGVVTVIVPNAIT